MVKTRHRKYPSPAVSEEETFVKEVFADDTSDMDMSSDSEDEELQDIMNHIFNAETEVETDIEGEPIVPENSGPTGDFFDNTVAAGDIPMPSVRPDPDPLDTDISSTEFEGFSTEESDFSTSRPSERFSRHVDFEHMWSERMRPPIRLTFTGRPGMTYFKRLNFPEEPKPVDYLNLFLSDSDYQYMADETNRYYHQSTDDKNIRPFSRLKQWREVTRDEMKVFMAMTIAMGLVVQGDFTEYWSTSDVTSTPFFPKCMPRDRFWLILTYFLLTDVYMPKRTSSTYSHMNKLGPL